VSCAACVVDSPPSQRALRAGTSSPPPAASWDGLACGALNQPQPLPVTQQAAPPPAAITAGLAGKCHAAGDALERSFFGPYTRKPHPRITGDSANGNLGADLARQLKGAAKVRGPSLPSYVDACSPSAGLGVGSALGVEA
jgi:hypothetical protein